MLKKSNVLRLMSFVLIFSLVFAFTGCKSQGDLISVNSDTSTITSLIESEDTVESNGSDTSEVTGSENIVSSEITDTSKPSNDSSSGGGNNSTSDNTSSTTQPTVTSADKPSVKNTAHLFMPLKSMVDSEATAMWNSIMNAKCAIPNVSGTVWYVSNKGNDANDGKSSSSPLATIAALKSKEFKAGDAILFECGGVYRGTLSLQNNMFVGSYGSGDKPCIYQSAQNYATATWTNQSGSIWKLETKLSAEAGVVVLNHGEKYGVRVKSLAELKDNYDFYFDGSYLYLYSSNNPASSFSSIEIGTAEHIISINGSDNVTIDNLTIKYGGLHGISCTDGTTNIQIRNCEIGWVGGAGTPIGNGIEFWNDCDDIIVENCWVYQCFDSGLTFQGRAGNYSVNNLTFRNNLIERCNFDSIEYWVNPSNTSMSNISITGNILRFAGYGWGGYGCKYRGDWQTYIKSCDHIGTFKDQSNIATNFVISNNIMEKSTGGLINIFSTSGTLPELKNNTYIAATGESLGKYESQGLAVQNASRAEKFISEIFKDIGGKFILYTE